MTVSADAFDLLGLSPALGRILRFFMLRPEARIHQRGLQRTLGLGSASTQRELERLQQLGILEHEVEGRRTLYSLVQRSPQLRALERLEATSQDPSALIRDALVDVEGIDAAFIFGSVARDTARPDSDIDLFVLERGGFDRRAFYNQLSEAQLLLDRDINAVRYTRSDLGGRLGDPEHPARAFVQDFLEGPRILVVGSTDALDAWVQSECAQQPLGTVTASG